MYVVTAEVVEGMHNITYVCMYVYILCVCTYVCVNEFHMQKMLVMELLHGGNLKNYLQSISKK